MKFKSSLHCPATVACAILFSLLTLFPNANAASLEKLMKNMGGAYKQLSAELTSPDSKITPEQIALAKNLTKWTNESKDQIPDKASDLSGEEKQKFIEGYKAELTALAEVSTQLETALSAGKAADAVKCLEQLKALRSKGHKSYK